MSQQTKRQVLWVFCTVGRIPLSTHTPAGGGVFTQGEASGFRRVFSKRQEQAVDSSILDAVLEYGKVLSTQRVFQPLIQ